MKDQLRSLLAASQAMVSSLAIEDVLDRVLAGVCDLFQASAAAIWQIEPGGVLKRLSTRGLSDAYVQAVSQLSLARGVTGLAAREHRVVAIADVALDPLVQVRALWHEEGIKSFASAPLTVRDRTIGALNVYWRSIHHLTADERELLLGFANQAAAGIENARLHAATERVLAEVSAQKETLDGIVKNAQDGIVLIDQDMRVVLFSPACERLTGWSAADIVGRNCRQFLRCHQPDESAMCDGDCLMRRLFFEPSQDGEPYGEFLVNTRDGRERWVGASWAPTRDGPTDKPAAVMVLRDITAAKQVDRMKSSIISLVSHELRTPLTSIRALSELLVEHEFESHEARGLMRTVSQEAQRMDRLIGNILDIARIEGGRLPYHPQPVDLVRLVHQAVDLLRGQAPGHQFVVRAPADLPIVEADPDRLRQVLDNLLANAVKYSPEGGRIAVDLQFCLSGLPAQSPNGNDRKGRGLANARPGQAEVCVSILDEGIGIPRDELARVFEPFHRVDTSDASHVRGTGLGLHIARSLVELHGGRIWADSPGPGLGATFVFTLPLRGT